MLIYLLNFFNNLFYFSLNPHNLKYSCVVILQIRNLFMHIFLTLNFFSGMLRVVPNRKMKRCMNVQNLESKKLIFLYLSVLIEREFSFLIYLFLYNTTFIYFIFIFMFLIFKHCYNKRIVIFELIFYNFKRKNFTSLKMGFKFFLKK